MRQIDQNFQPLPHDLMALLTAHIDHEADPTSVVLKCRIVQSVAVSSILERFVLHDENCCPCSGKASATANEQRQAASFRPSAALRGTSLMMPWPVQRRLCRLLPPCGIHCPRRDDRSYCEHDHFHSPWNGRSFD